MWFLKICKGLWHCMKEIIVACIGIPQESIVVLQKMCKNNEVQVEVGNTVSSSCRTTKGLKQWHGFSPTLFKINLESVLYTWKKKCRNMELPIGDITMHHHLFADDQLIAQDKEDAEYMTKN